MGTVCPPALHVHFTPTSSSWLNHVERWLAEPTRKQIQRGVHGSVAQLEADVAAFIDAHSENPRPFKWVKSADDILASVKRSCRKTPGGTADSGDEDTLLEFWPLVCMFTEKHHTARGVPCGKRCPEVWRTGMQGRSTRSDHEAGLCLVEAGLRCPEMGER